MEEREAAGTRVSSSCSSSRKMELILESCNTMKNSKVSLAIWGRHMALDLLYSLTGFHIGWRPCVFLLFLRTCNEKFRLVVCIHREYPKVHTCVFSLPLISGRQKEESAYLEIRKLEPREDK